MLLFFHHLLVPDCSRKDFGSADCVFPLTTLDQLIEVRIMALLASWGTIDPPKGHVVARHRWLQAIEMLLLAIVVAAAALVLTLLLH